METPGQRLKALMKYYRLTQESLGQRIGVTKGYVSLLMSGQNPITKSVIDGLAKSFPELNVDWLLFGRGDMFFEKREPEPGILTGVMEAEPPVYERGHGGGVLEAALGRLASVEDRLSDALDRVSALEDRVRELEEGKDGKG